MSLHEPRLKALFICGSLNQTTQMHQIAQQLPELRHIYTPYYGNGDFELLRRLGLLEATIGGNKLQGRCLEYLHDHGLDVDYGARRHPDVAVVFQCSDLVRPRNIRGRRVVLVQEGMTDPESVLLPLVQRFRWLPGWLGGTSATGLSDQYARFCVASEGFRELFASRGVRRDKMVVTGIPNFDDCERFRKEDFPLRGFVLCCTSDVREVFWWEDRRKFIAEARAIASTHNKPLIFKLHPNEHVGRATEELRRHAPEARIYVDGSAEAMIAHCDVLVCQYSSVAFVGLALGKEVHSFFPGEELSRLLPLQHGRAAANIANVARRLLAMVERQPITAMPDARRSAA